MTVSWISVCKCLLSHERHWLAECSFFVFVDSLPPYTHNSLGSSLTWGFKHLDLVQGAGINWNKNQHFCISFLRRHHQADSQVGLPALSPKCVRRKATILSKGEWIRSHQPREDTVCGSQIVMPAWSQGHLQQGHCRIIIDGSLWTQTCCHHVSLISTKLHSFETCGLYCSFWWTQVQEEKVRSFLILSLENQCKYKDNSSWDCASRLEWSWWDSLGGICGTLSACVPPTEVVTCGQPRIARSDFSFCFQNC